MIITIVISTETKTLLTIADKMGKRELTEGLIAKQAGKPADQRVAWLKKQLERALSR